MRVAGRMNPFDEKTQSVVRRAARVIDGLGARAYLVGGAVRDGLMGKMTGDVDVVVSGSANEVGAALAESLRGHLVRLHPEFDVARVIVWRDGHRVTVDLLSLVEGGILDDLGRRDFTVNAVAIPLELAAGGDTGVFGYSRRAGGRVVDSRFRGNDGGGRGNDSGRGNDESVGMVSDSDRREAAMGGEWGLIDPLGGARDVEAGIIRAVSERVFLDDPVRLLRAVRLAAETGFEIESGTESLIRRDAHLLTRSSAERTREEFLRILAAPGAARWVGLMDGLGLLSALIPELDRARGVTQPREHYYDVFGHLLAAVDFADEIVHGRYSVEFVGEMMPGFDGMEEYFGRDASDGYSRGTILKLTALLHDIAKPDTKTIEPSGRVRFFGHSEKGEETAGEILRRLRVSRKGAGMVKRMIRHHLRPRQMAGKGELPTRRAIHRYYRDLGDVALDTLYLNMADFLAARGPLLTPSEMGTQVGVIGHILAVGPQRKTPVASRKGLLSGHDIMNEFQIESGPLVGRLLKSVAQAEAEGRVGTREEALKLARANFKTGVAGG